MTNNMSDADASDSNVYTDVGILRVSPNSGKKYFTPDVEDSLKPVVGMEFDSIDHAFAYYQRYANAGGFEVRKGTQYTLKNGVIKLKYFVCTKEGFKSTKQIDTLDDENGPKISRKRPSKRTGCLAQLRLDLTNDSKYKVYNFLEEHNHSFVDEQDIHLITASRKLTYTQEQMLTDLENLNIGPVRAFNIMRITHGGFEKVGVTKSDVKNFKKDINLYIGDYDADMVVRRLLKKKRYLNNFSCKYTTREKGELNGLFWADEESKRYFYTFGDVISFDATYRSNRYKMVFVPFTGIDNHNRNVTFGAALLGSETTESYCWLLNCFKEAFGFEPRVVVTDQDPAMKRAIEIVFTGSRHRFCMWHVMQKLAEKVGTRLCNSTDFKDRICGIVWTDSLKPDEFEARWDIIINDFDLRSNTWLTDMYGLREYWIPAYFRDEVLSGLMRTTSRSESENNFFGQMCNPRSTLMEFISHFDAAMESQRHEHRKNDHDTRYTTPDIWSDFVLEKQAAEIYTRTVFFDVQREIDDAIRNCMSASITTVGDFLKISIKDFVQPVISFFDVMFRKEDMTIYCTCLRFEQFGLLCRHIFYVLKLFDIREFPKNYILRRWTREAVPNSPSACSLHPESSFENEAHRDSVVRDIMFSAEYVINRMITDMNNLCLFRDHVKEFMSKADDCQVKAPPPSRRDRIAEITSSAQDASIGIRLPVRIRNKGCGTHKRLKSTREKAISQAGKKPRRCHKCNNFGHDSRTCDRVNGKGYDAHGASSSHVDDIE